MTGPMAKASLLATLDIALSTENIPAEEPSSYGDYLCHECGARTSQPTGGCVAPGCWVETAETLRRMLVRTDGGPAR